MIYLTILKIVIFLGPKYLNLLLTLKNISKWNQKIILNILLSRFLQNIMILKNTLFLVIFHGNLDIHTILFLLVYTKLLLFLLYLLLKITVTKKSMMKQLIFLTWIFLVKKPLQALDSTSILPNLILIIIKSIIVEKKFKSLIFSTTKDSGSLFIWVTQNLLNKLSHISICLLVMNLKFWDGTQFMLQLKKNYF